MKMVRMYRVAAVIALAALLLAPATASAATQWYRCKVNAAGPIDSGKTWFSLTDVEGSFTGTGFLAAEGREKEMQAIAMVSMVNDRVIMIRADVSANPRTVMMMLLTPDSE